MKELVNDSLLFRFLEKETSKPENDEIFQWVSCSEKNRKKFREVHQAYHLSRLRQYQSEIDVDIAWSKLYSRMPHLKNKTSLYRIAPVWKAAATIAIILAVGFCSLWSFDHFFFQSQTAEIQIESPAGEKSRVVLADGTHVWLNSQTVLKYDASAPRKVTLNGEAYFDVVKDPSHPFVVTTILGLKVTVLGTKFNLRSFADEAKVETTLEEGEISITGAGSKQPLVLSPGQQANYCLCTNKFEVRDVPAEIYSLWKNNELRFINISFSDLVPRIERWYGIKIDLDPRINPTDRFTMTIKTESLRELLNMMQLTSKFDYEINGEKVIIRAK